jgi:hypothetical protein
MTEARTERGGFRFRVKELADGTPWIMAEPLRNEVLFLKNAFVGFDLTPGTTLSQAERIAEFMNEHIDTMSMTVFDQHPMFKVKE